MQFENAAVTCWGGHHDVVILVDPLSELSDVLSKGCDSLGRNSCAECEHENSVIFLLKPGFCRRELTCLFLVTSFPGKYRMLERVEPERSRTLYTRRSWNATQVEEQNIASSCKFRLSVISISKAQSSSYLWTSFRLQESCRFRLSLISISKAQSSPS